MKKRLFSLYIKYKIIFNRPIYRVDILRYVKYIERFSGLCHSLFVALTRCNVSIITATPPFPLMDRENAKPFNARSLATYWWPAGDWTGGRMNFLNWLIDQYKDDKTDLKS